MRFEPMTLNNFSSSQSTSQILPYETCRFVLKCQSQAIYHCVFNAGLTRSDLRRMWPLWSSGNSTAGHDAIRPKQEGCGGAAGGGPQKRVVHRQKSMLECVCAPTWLTAWEDANNPSPWQHSSGFVRASHRWLDWLEGTVRERRPNYHQQLRSSPRFPITSQKGSDGSQVPASAALLLPLQQDLPSGENDCLCWIS